MPRGLGSLWSHNIMSIINIFTRKQVTNLKHLISVALVALSFAHPAFAADDTPAKPARSVKARPVPDVPFFVVNDNRLTYAYRFVDKFPGNTYPGGAHVLAFTHFDTWAYGTNFVNLLVAKFGQNAPAAPCILPNTGCGGMLEFVGIARSTLGFNEVFDTKAFSVGSLANVSLAVGAGEGMLNNYSALDRRSVFAGLQFAFALPYHGYFNITPEYYKAWEYTALTTSAYWGGVFPGAPNGWLDFNGTWAIDANYYMDLGFLPEWLPLAISGRVTVVAPIGTGAPAGVLPSLVLLPRATEISSEPIRLTLDFSKLVWGPKYSHFTDVWVAWKYDRNILGLDNAHNPACVSNTCEVSTVYAGITVKF